MIEDDNLEMSEERMEMLREMWLDRADLWRQDARRALKGGNTAHAEYCESKAWVCEENASGYGGDE